MLTPIPADRLERFVADRPQYAGYFVQPLPEHPGIYRRLLGLPHHNPLFEPEPWFEPAPPKGTADDAWYAAMLETLKRNGLENRHLFGVADDLDQIMGRMPWLHTDTQPYALELVLIERKHDPGWRWHKNGPYIGDFADDQRAEHLGDSDPAITEVLLFHVHQHRAD